MTPKFKAYATHTRVRGYYRLYNLIDNDGNKYVPHWRIPGSIDVGTKAFLGKRINNHHGKVAEWELWEIVVEQDNRYNCPKTIYSGGRYIFIRVNNW